MEYGVRKLQANPCEKANFFSKIFYGWTIPLYKRTYGKILDVSDVCKPLTEDQSRTLGHRLNKYTMQNKII